ncbi:serine protease gd-like [Cloeon dipterum]|uniref:serine protease gd-like n=1 Tax=Cloeon dipterum TaxID=197152 RepID=UPI00321FD13E
MLILNFFVGVVTVTSVGAASPKNHYAFAGGESYPNCGLIGSNRRSTSLDKNDATPGQNAYHANLVFSNFKSKYLKKEPCSGTLISKRAVLTSANCLFAGSKRLATNNIKVTLGAYDLSKPIEQSRQTVTPAEIVVHPNYNRSFEHNLGILIFEESAITLSEHVKPACLWHGDFDIAKSANSVGEVVGWGIGSDSSQIDRLQMNHLRVAILEECGNTTKPTEIFCVAHTNDPEGCAYDDGVGFILTKDEKKYLRGVFIHGLLPDDKKYTAKKSKICFPSRRPVVSDLDSSMDWIVNTVPDISRQ